MPENNFANISTSRRSFIGALGAGAVVALDALTPSSANAAVDEIIAAQEAADGTAVEVEWVNPLDMGRFDNAWSGPGSADGSWLGTPAELEAVGGSNMPLDEVNRRRQLYIDSMGDWTKADGTVVPAIYVKARALLNTIGYGIGNNLDDNSFDMFLYDFDEEECQAFLDCPWGVEFSTLDFSEKNGVSIEDSTRLLESLASKGYLGKRRSSSGVRYQIIAFSPRGINIMQPQRDADKLMRMFAGSWSEDVYQLAYGPAGTPWFIPFPVNADVVKDGQISPFDDYATLLKDKKIAVCLCNCRASMQTLSGIDIPTDPDFVKDFTTEAGTESGIAHAECCIQTGDDAECMIEFGVGREVSYEEAMEIIQRNIDEGCVIERNYSKDAEAICCCDGAHCVSLTHFMAIANGGNIEDYSRTINQISHYTLEVDYEKCLRCGMCASRCPLKSVTMEAEYEGETGYPLVASVCVRCGQCAYVCPAEARKLVPRPAEEIHEYPATGLEECNEKAGDRFEHGLIY